MKVKVEVSERTMWDDMKAWEMWFVVLVLPFIGIAFLFVDWIKQA